MRAEPRRSDRLTWSRGRLRVPAGLVLLAASLAVACKSEGAGDAAPAEGSVRVILPEAPSASPAPAAGEQALDWRAFDGGDTEVQVEGAAWVVVPAASRWDSLKMTRLAFHAKKDGGYVFDGGKVTVPGSFVEPGPPARPIAPGDAVLASVHGASAPGRVEAIEGGRAKVRVVWLDAVEEIDVLASELLLLDGGLRFGQPVAVRTGDDRSYARFVRALGTHSWVLDWSGAGRKVEASAVEPLAVHSRLASGAEVLAVSLGVLAPATVVEVLDGGLRYRVRGQTGDEETLPFTEVAAGAR